MEPSSLLCCLSGVLCEWVGSRLSSLLTTDQGGRDCPWAAPCCDTVSRTPTLSTSPGEASCRSGGMVNVKTGYCAVGG